MKNDLYYIETGPFYTDSQPCEWNQQMKSTAGRRRDMDGFETQVDVDVRYRDIDSVGHVNNAVYVSYLEEARVSYIQNVFDEALLDPGFVVVNLTINYERQVTLGETVTVGIRVSNIGTSSITMAYEIWANGERAATAETVIVPVAESGAESRPVPDDWRERIAAHEGTSF